VDSVFLATNVTTIILALFAALPPTLLALAAYVQARKTHGIVNSRMDEFKANLEVAATKAAELAFANGLKVGKEQGAAAANVRTDALNPPHPA